MIKFTIRSIDLSLCVFGTPKKLTFNFLTWSNSYFSYFRGVWYTNFLGEKVLF